MQVNRANSNRVEMQVNRANSNRLEIKIEEGSPGIVTRNEDSSAFGLDASGSGDFSGPGDGLESSGSKIFPPLGGPSSGALRVPRDPKAPRSPREISFRGSVDLTPVVESKAYSPRVIHYTHIRNAKKILTHLLKKYVSVVIMVDNDGRVIAACQLDQNKQLKLLLTKLSAPPYFLQEGQRLGEKECIALFDGYTKATRVKSSRYNQSNFFLESSTSPKKPQESVLSTTNTAASPIGTKPIRSRFPSLYNKVNN